MNTIFCIQLVKESITRLALLINVMLLEYSTAQLRRKI